MKQGTATVLFTEKVCNRISSRSAYMAAKSLKKRSRNLEQIILLDPVHTFFYIKTVLKKRWKRAEKVILKNPTTAAQYAAEVLKRRWKPAEDYILGTDHPWSNTAVLIYARLLKRRWKEGEHLILSDPRSAFYYAKDVIKGRWDLAEEIIKESPEFSYHYAKDIMKGKLPENMHNHMMLLAMKNPNNRYLKLYFGCKKYA